MGRDLLAMQLLLSMRLTSDALALYQLTGSFERNLYFAASNRFSASQIEAM